VINCSDNINIVFNFDGVDLKVAPKNTNLGHSIEPNVCSNIMGVPHTLTGSVDYIFNNLIDRFYNIKYQLLKSYWTSFYGCTMWNVTGHYISRFYISWRKSISLIRKLFDLPYRIHCNL